MGNNNIKTLTSRKAVSRTARAVVFRATGITRFRTGARVSSPSSGVRPGARVLNLELPTSFGWLRHFHASTPSALVFKPLVFAKAVFTILAIVFLSACLGNSAYAASYLNVSSSGSVSFGSIRPTSAGTSSTGSDTLTVHTDCSTGYSVYVSGQNGKDTNLTNSSVSSNNTISTSSNAIGSAGSLGSNTWGLNYENTGAYVGLPTYADATNTALTTKTSVAEESTVPIYYGIKVDTSITPGTYTGDVLYTVLMDSSCLAYTVVFDANGGAGEMSNQSIMAGTKTALDENTFARDGYTFLGWSTKANGRTETAVDGVGTEADVDYADKAEVTDLTSGGSNITLYAIWEQDVETMQGWTGCSALATGQAVTLKDSRDNKRYAIKKLPDGKCWMVQNLRLVGSRVLTPSDSDVSSNFTIPTATANSEWCTDQTTSCMDKSIVYYVSSEASDETTASYYGALYNWYTSTAGTGKYATASGTTVNSSICPKGWRLPTGNSSGEFEALDIAYGGTGLGRYHANTYNSFVGTYLSNNNGGFEAPGYIDEALKGIGVNGHYWSSVGAPNRGGYVLAIGSNNYIGPISYARKYYGNSVRCIAQDSYTIAYPSDGADSGETSKTSETVFQNNGTVDVAMPTAGTLVKDGYEFKGWALTSDATSATYTAGQTVALSALLTAASSASQTTTAGSTITLYPVWEIYVPDDGNLGSMQDFNCANLASGHAATLTDSRDGQTYKIYRIPANSTATNVAGKCIMTQDLSLGYVTGGSITAGSNLSLTTSTSNFDANASSPSYESFTLSGTQTVTYVNSANNGTGWSTTNSYTNKQYTNGPRSGYESYSSHTYYSWGAALVVCPKGWRLPTGDEYANSTSSNTSTNGIAYAAGNSISAIQAAPWNFVPGGQFAPYGWNVQGSFGQYWSATQSGSATGHYLYFYSSNVYLGYSTFKNYGHSVRCISDPVTYTYTLEYSGVAASANVPEEQTYIGTETSHTFIVPSAKPTGYIPLVFSNYTYNGTTYNPGDTITLSSSSPSATLTANWTRSCSISSSTGCKLANGRTYILGYGGKTITWNNMFSGATNVKNHNATVNSSYNGTAICPSGYFAPTITDYDALVQAYGGASHYENGRSGYKESTGALYKTLGLTSSRYYWAATEYSNGFAHVLYIDRNSSRSSGSYHDKDNGVYALCYK